MGKGLGIDYVTWWEILKKIAPTATLHVGHKNKIPILWVYGEELTMSHVEKSQNASPPHQNFMWETKTKFQSYRYRVRN